jgi:hypothetical protein
MSITYLGQGKLLAPSKERTLALGRSEQRLDLLLHGSKHILSGSITLRLIGSAQTGEERREDLADKCIDEESNTGAVEGVLGRA